LKTKQLLYNKKLSYHQGTARQRHITLEVTENDTTI